MGDYRENAVQMTGVVTDLTPTNKDTSATTESVYSGGNGKAIFHATGHAKSQRLSTNNTDTHSLSKGGERTSQPVVFGL